MAKNRCPPRSSALKELLTGVNCRSGSDLVNVFIKAVESGVSRSHVVELFSEHRDELKFSEDELMRFLKWCDQNDFLAVTDKAAGPDSDNGKTQRVEVGCLDDQHHAIDDRDAALRTTKHLFEAIGQSANEVERWFIESSRTHKYGNFYPWLGF